MKLNKENYNNYIHKNWVKIGLIWGAFMFLFMSIVFPYFIGQKITRETLLLGLITWAISGLCFGYVMRLYQKFINKNNKG